MPVAAGGASVPTRVPGQILTGPPRGPVPSDFFGIAPQTTLTPADVSRMRAGGISTVRLPVVWSAIQPRRNGDFDWSSVDSVVEIAARGGLRVLPFLYGPPRWLTHRATTLPVGTSRQRAAWKAFLQAAVHRYGPGGTFWAEHTPGSGKEPQVPYDPGVPYQPGVQYQSAISKPLPIRNWQIWNEANFFYFAYPVSPYRYGKLVKLSGRAIKAVDPGAKVILSGLYGAPTAAGARGMDAADFLRALYRVPGIKAYFDGVALHPYAVDTATLEDLVEGIHQVSVENHDRVGLYITEIGWGSQNDFNRVAFEQGLAGQRRQLRSAYSYLIDNQRRLGLRQVYWFSWKDMSNSCNFCDSVGFFRAGPRFRPKPAWHTFVALARASLRH